MTAPSDYIKLHFIIFLWSFTAIIGLLISIPAVELVFFRTLLATLGLLILFLLTGKEFRLPSADIFRTVLTGFIVAAHWITFFGSARLSNASVSLVGVATGSLWTSLLEPLMNKSRIRRFEVFLGLIVLIGLYIIYHFDFEYPVGLAVSVLSGLLSAVFFVINGRLTQRLPSRKIVFYEMTGACAASALFLLGRYIISGESISWPIISSDWVYLVILSLVCTLYAYDLSLKLMKKFSVFFIQLTLNLEPVYGIILALIVFGNKEKMNFTFYLGTLLILTAVFAYPILKKRFSGDPFMDVPSQQTPPM